MMLRISVIGSSGPISQEVQKIAMNVGKEIAKAGAVLLSGGRGGVMEVASKGAKAAGGLTIGILPESNLEFANPHLDVAITTGMGYARNFINVCSSDAVISISGAGGTLSEIGYAIALNKLLILMKGTGGVTDLIAQNLSVFADAKIKVVKEPKEAIKLVIKKFSDVS